MAFIGKNNTDVSTDTDDTRLKKNLGFMSWVQEYSKKIVTITFFLFVVANIYFLVMLWFEYRVSYDISYIDTFISEMHQTFREVIGGYMLKAAFENVLKIGGSYMESYMTTKTTIIEQKAMAAYGGRPANDEEEEEVVDDSEDPLAARNQDNQEE